MGTSDLFRPRDEHQEASLLFGRHVCHGQPERQHGGVVLVKTAVVLGRLRQLSEIQLLRSGDKRFELLGPDLTPDKRNRKCLKTKQKIYKRSMEKRRCGKRDVARYHRGGGADGREE